jgi:hypothetical protein
VKTEEIQVSVSTIYGAQMRKGLVVLEIGGQAFQISPHGARAIAEMLRGGAEAAETDELLMEICLQEIQVTEFAASKLLQRIREKRELLQRENFGLIPEPQESPFLD